MAYNSGAVSDDAIGHKKPITLQTGRALRDNPIEIASGGFGAPITEAAWHAYDAETWGDGANGLVYDYGIHGAVSSVYLGAILAGYEYRVVYEQIAIATSPSRNLFFDIHVNGAYRAIKMLDMSSSPTGEIGSYSVYRHTGFSVIHMAGTARTAYILASEYAFSSDNSSSPYTTGLALTGATSTSGVGISFLATSIPTHMQLRLSGSTLSAGKIWLQKRKVAG